MAASFWAHMERARTPQVHSHVCELTMAEHPGIQKHLSQVLRGCHDHTMGMSCPEWSFIPGWGCPSWPFLPHHGGQWVPVSWPWVGADTSAVLLTLAKNN